MLKEILLVLAGAISAIFGGFLATWYQAKKARKIRREEVIGEKQVEVYQQAAMRISTLKSFESFFCNSDTFFSSFENSSS